jgi:hypothetical protein
MEAWQAWMREMIEVSRADAAAMQPKPRRERGKLYPLEP